MTIKDDCQRLFKTDNLYKVLSLKKTENLTEGVVKKAYYKASLLYHPDKAPAEGVKLESTEKFQLISKVYTILVDKDKRDVYDSSGEVPNDLELESNFDWYRFWRNLYKITTDNIKSFEKNYKGSAEEKADLKRHYNDGDGSIDYIIDNLLCASDNDKSRLISLLKEMIDAGELEDNPNFSKESAKKKNTRKNRAKKEAKKAAKAKQSQSDGQSSLEDAIGAMAVGGNADLLANLEEKCGSKAAVKGKAKKGGGEAAKEPTSELKGKGKAYGQDRYVNQPAKRLVLVISNSIFTDLTGKKPLPTRMAAEKDAADLVAMFIQEGFEVDLKQNLTAAEMRQAILAYRDDPKHNSRDSAVVVVISHGRLRGIYGCDGQLVDMDEVIDPFRVRNCQSLAGKPKLIFIQACDVPPMDSYDDVRRPHSDICEPNLFMSYSATKDLHRPQDGDCYIHAICRIFPELCGDIESWGLIMAVVESDQVVKRSNGAVQVLMTIPKRKN